MAASSVGGQLAMLLVPLVLCAAPLAYASRKHGLDAMYSDLVRPRWALELRILVTFLLVTASAGGLGALYCYVDGAGSQTSDAGIALYSLYLAARVAFLFLFFVQTKFTVAFWVAVFADLLGLITLSLFLAVTSSGVLFVVAYLFDIYMTALTFSVKRTNSSAHVRLPTDEADAEDVAGL
jgi:tryptophan-rich sensory protein